MKHGVPIQLVLRKCDSLRFRIALSGGKFTNIETDYPKIEDPDNKGNQYSWDPRSPSGDYWLFRFYAWEWSGWRLVHKRTGRLIETVNECADALIAVGASFISTVCSCAYENVIPTLYIADIRSTDIQWSGGLPLENCKEHDVFRLEGMRFVNEAQLRLYGNCPGSASQSAEIASQTFTISDLGVLTQQHGNIRSADWK